MTGYIFCNFYTVHTINSFLWYIHSKICYNSYLFPFMENRWRPRQEQIQLLFTVPMHNPTKSKKQFQDLFVKNALFIILHFKLWLLMQKIDLFHKNSQAPIKLKIRYDIISYTYSKIRLNITYCHFIIILGYIVRCTFQNCWQLWLSRSRDIVWNS